MRGKTISIYIPDANPKSIKICEIINSIVKWIYIPRNKVLEASNRKELQQPWIYFLIWDHNEIWKPLIYIWEAENLLDRIKQHNQKKDFWNSVICFISEKQNINKAHIKYLESYCYNKAKEIKKCELENTINPTQSSLTEQDEDFALSFFDDLKIIISTLWFSLFEEMKKEYKNIFHCKGKDAIASWEYNENWLTVFKWWKANLEESKSSIWSWVSWIRKKLLANWILKREWNVYVFTEDYTFSSPSAASVAILWRYANWWNERKDKDWKTMNEKIRKI